jgi:hypothetical protein
MIMTTLDRIGERVATETGIGLGALKSHLTLRSHQDARSVFAAIAEIDGYSNEAIGKWLGRANARNSAQVLLDRVANLPRWHQKVLHRLIDELVSQATSARRTASNGVTIAASTGRHRSKPDPARPFSFFDVSPDAIRPDCRVSAEAFAADSRRLYDHEINRQPLFSPEGSAAAMCAV